MGVSETRVPLHVLFDRNFANSITFGVYTYNYTIFIHFQTYPYTGCRDVYSVQHPLVIKHGNGKWTIYR